MTWFEGLITFLQVAAIVSGAAFAALALFTEYKKDGKVTRYGRFAAIGIVLSALFSLGTQWGQSRLDLERSKDAQGRAREQLVQEGHRFDQQMQRLNFLSSDLRELNTQNLDLRHRAEQSLLQLATVQMRLRQSLGATREIAQLERVMWDDANRVVPSGLNMVVTYRCLFQDRQLPSLLADQMIAYVRVAPASPDRPQANAFSTAPQLTADHMVEFSSIEHRTLSDGGSVSGRYFTAERMQFLSFVTDDLGAFGRPEAWRNVLVEVVVTGNVPGSRIGQLRVAFSPETGGIERIQRYYAVGGNSLEHADDIVVPPCHADMALSVNGRLVATAEALPVFYVYIPGSDGNTVLKFPIVRGHDDTFPAFSGRLAQ